MVNRLGAGTKAGQLGIWDGTQWVAGDPDCNIVKWGGTALTARDITTLLDHLNVDLSTRALETGGNLAALVTGMNTSKWGGTALTGRDITTLLDHLNVNLDTRASEATLVAALDTDKFRVLPMAKGKTTILKNNGRGGVGTVNLYTVTAGKTFYLVHAQAVHTDTVANERSYGQLEVDTGGDGVFRSLIMTDCHGLNTMTAVISPNGLLSFPAGSVFRFQIWAGAGGGLNGVISGWEE